MDHIYTIPTSKVEDMIERFLKLYPQEEWGCGHIVLSDYNLEDDDILFCISQGCLFLCDELPDMDYVPDGTMQAIYFLVDLLKIPESERFKPDIE